MESANNPFRDLSPPQIYDLLSDPNNDLPTWPAEEVQEHYTSLSGPDAVRRSQPFIDILDKDGAFAPGWKGMDYGAGWGRLAALLLTKGAPEQLDLVDAWSNSISHIEKGGFKNRYWKVAEILRPGDIPESTYSFVYAFSIFTHLSPRAFWTNLHFLKKSIRSPGTVYFTVRHNDFARAAFPERLTEISATLTSEGFWFTPMQPKRGTAQPVEGIEPVYGTAIITRELLHRLGQTEYLGKHQDQGQHVYALRV